MANEVRKFVKEALSNEADALMNISQDIGEEYEKAIELISACQGKVIVSGIGKSGHIGKKIAASLSSTGTPSFFVHSAEAIHGDSGMIGRQDVVILLSNSGETHEVLNLLNIVEKIGASRIAITQNAESSLGKRSEVALTYHYQQEADHLGLAPTTSALLQLAIGDALAVVLCRMKGFSKEDFYLYHPGGSLGQQLSKDTNQT